jgi:hypothetical protein
MISTICLLFLLLASCGFAERQPRHRRFATSDLLIGTAAMPAGWSLTYGPGYAHDDPFSHDAAMVEFKADIYPGPRGAAQSIYRYSTIRSASVSFGDRATLPGSTPQGWAYQSPIADEEIFVCYDYEGREPHPICWWVARYEEYVVYFRAWLITGLMTLQEIEIILIAIDNRMGQYLDK